MGSAGVPAGPTLPVSAPLPWVRTFAFSLVSVAFAVCAHTSADHRLPSWGLVVAAVPVVTVALRPLAAAERRAGSLLAGLVALQLTLHALFVTADGSRGGGGAAGWLCCGNSGLSAGNSGLYAGNGAALPNTSTAGGLALSRAALVQLTVHLLAAAALAWALRHQERALWTRVRAAGQAAAGLLRASILTLLTALVGQPVMLRPVSRAQRSPVNLVKPTGLLVVARRARRGPPAPALAAA